MLWDAGRLQRSGSLKESIFHKKRRSVVLQTMSRLNRLENFLLQHPTVAGISIGLVDDYQVSGHAVGHATISSNEVLDVSHYLQCASLSKTVATAFAIEYFASRGVDFLTTRVNDILSSAGAEWRIKVNPESRLPQSMADSITINMLVNHTALGMHYVFGVPLTEEYPGPIGFLTANPVAKKLGYNPLLLEREPGTKFSYSGGGYVVLEYLIETLEGRPISEVTRAFLDRVGLQEFAFSQLVMPLNAKLAHGYLSPSEEVPYLAFPAFAAGALCTPRALAQFLSNLAAAYRCPAGISGISHHTARLMLGDATSVDLGAMDFMGAKMGLGVFVATAGPNKLMLHQAANDGYRGVYMLCFDGPDAGKGFVILCNGDNPAVLLISALCRYLLGPEGTCLSVQLFRYFSH
jgi:CubicO group peptidase (beta-lactamase class C family)